MPTFLPTRPPDLPTDTAILGRASTENFRVASRLLPRAARRHLLAFYGYARFIDQLGDDYRGDRSVALAWAATELQSALDRPDDPALHHLIAGAARSVLSLGADPAPLRDLIEANRLDQTVTHYDTWQDLLGYCRLSANPVGRLVLAAFGVSGMEEVALSDDVCTALQVIEHLQDVAEDALAGRVYLPAVDLARFGVADGELAERARTPTPAPMTVRSLVAFEASRARQLLDRGAALVGALRGRSRVAVAGFVAGGYAALDAVASNGYDPFSGTTAPTPMRVTTNLVALLGPGRRPGRLRRRQGPS